MPIQILPTQVPQLWQAIKYAAVSANRIEEKDRGAYLNKLLLALMSDRAQCFVRLSDERRLMAIAVTRISQDEITGEKSLFVECLYSFEPVSEPQWQSDMEFIKQYAQRVGCHKIITYSNVGRVFEIVLSIGFSERYRCFAMEV